MSDKRPFLTGEIGRQLILMLTGAVFIIVIYISGDHAGRPIKGATSLH